MKTRMINTKTLLLGAVAGGLGGTAVAQERAEIPGVEKRYYVASKLFGPDRVQLHSIHHENDQSIHLVEFVDCTNRTIASVYKGLTAPTAFPIDHDDTNVAADFIAQDSDAARIGEHACSRHGLTLAER